MAITTKAALADELGVTRSRVSQYVAKGLPVRSDGKIDRDEALNWVKANQLSVGCRDKGVVRAHRLAQEASRRAIKSAAPALAATVRADLAEFKPDSAEAVRVNCEQADPIGGVAVMAVMRMAYDAPAAAVTMAVHTGSSMAQAYRLRDLVTLAVMGHAETALRDMNVKPFADGAELQWRLDKFAQNNWEALAKVAGEPCDVTGWEAAALAANRADEVRDGNG